MATVKKTTQLEDCILLANLELLVENREKQRICQNKVLFGGVIPVLGN